MEWLVIDKQDGQLLLVSKYLLDGKQYNETNEAITWENSTLRQWLNETFINTAFDVEDQAQILTTTVAAAPSAIADTEAGNDTEDRIFILSVEEVNRYFTTPDSKQCAPTNYAISNGVFINYDVAYTDWWLRTLGSEQNSAASVNRGGIINEGGTDVDHTKYAVRPALWVKPAA